MEMDPQLAAASGQRRFPCRNCGATLEFAPGTTALVCPYCGTANEIATGPPDVEAGAAGVNTAGAITGGVEELDLTAHLRAEDFEEQLTVRCQTCGAETTLAPNITAGRCPFCGSAIVAQGVSQRKIKPRSLLPFAITREQAAASFKRWIASLWFAPSELKQRADRAEIAGVYIPCWTYDADTTTRYTGQRGDDYWDTEFYTAFENGRSVRRTRRVKKTRWWPASGTVANAFDDVLVLASRSLPSGYAEALEPWDLKSLVPYRDEYLSGFIAESYQVTLPEGFDLAKGLMAPHIHATIRRDIGGDHQRIHSTDTRYFNVTFKHALLPVWISAYRFGEKTYRFLVNARSGEVQGERPYSYWKIFFAILAALAVVGIVMLVISSQR